MILSKIFRKIDVARLLTIDDHSFYIFLYQGFLSRTLVTHRKAGEGKEASFIPMYRFYPLTNIQTFICNFACEMTRSSRPEVFLKEGVLKKCSKFTGEHPCRSVISIKLLYNFIDMALRYGCF